MPLDKNYKGKTMKYFDFIDEKVKSLTGLEVQNLSTSDMDLLLDEFSHDYPEFIDKLMVYLKHHLEESDPKMYDYCLYMQNQFADEAKYDSIDDDVQRKIGNINSMDKRFTFDDGTY